MQRSQFSEAGFSLLEILVTLTIISITSALLFQTLLSQVQLTSRVETASLNASRAIIRSAGFQDVIKGLVPSWPEEIDTRFVATDAQISGLTSQSLLSSRKALTPFQMRISGDPSIITYSEHGQTITLGQFSELARFSYLGADGDWYPQWPPEKTPDFGAFDDSLSYKTPPLPIAVRIQTETQADLDWISQLDWQAAALPRRQDIEEN